MCIIAICKDRKLTNDELQECWSSNSHGAGYAVYNEQKRIWNWKKGIMELQQFREMYNEIKNTLHVVHFRISTAGGVSKELTHPFEIIKEKIPALRLEGKSKYLLFHNGHIGRWEELLLKSLAGKTVKIPKDFMVMSDTRAFSIYLSLNFKDKVLEIPKQVGKFVLCTQDGFTKFGQWEEEKGVLFSNSSFKKTKYVYYFDKKRFYNDDDWFFRK